jgi:hypothetical protein
MKSGTPELVINTGPVIALVAATGGLDWLAELYQTIWLPETVYSELSAGGPGAPEPSRVHAAAKVVRILPQSGELPAELARQLDPGEAWVIQSALAQKSGDSGHRRKGGPPRGANLWTTGYGLLGHSDSRPAHGSHPQP